MMYFVSIEKLKNDIVEGKLTEKDKFLYVLLFVIIQYLVYEILTLLAFFPLIFGEDMVSKLKPNIWDMLLSLGWFVVPVAGTIFAFRANKGNAGTDFVGRYFSISFVVGVRLFLPVFFITMFVHIFAGALKPDETDIPTSPLTMVPELLLISFVFWRICKHIGDVANATPQTT